MKKIIILFIVLCCVSIFGFSQSRLGFTEDSIRKEYYLKDFTVVVATDSSRRFIAWQDDDIISYYYFDKEGLCDLCYVQMKNNGVLNGYVERFNKQYVIVSNTEWKLYSDNGIIICKLLKLGGKMYFEFKEIN